MVEPELDLAAHELYAGEGIVRAQECFCECGLPPGEECYACWETTSVCDASPGECLCSTSFCESMGCVAEGDCDGSGECQGDGGDCAVADGGEDGGDGDDGGGGQVDGGGSESV